MNIVHAGVLSGQSEEVIDGVVLHNDPDGILGSWKATDAESGIMRYMVAVGTSEGRFYVIEYVLYCSGMWLSG